MNKLNELLRFPEKIPCDKRLHYMIGVVVISMVLMITQDLLIVSSVLLAVAYGIEFYQKITHSGHFDHYDALAVWLGGVTVYIPWVS